MLLEAAGSGERSRTGKSRGDAFCYEIMTVLGAVMPLTTTLRASQYKNCLHHIEDDVDSDGHKGCGHKSICMDCTEQNWQKLPQSRCTPAQSTKVNTFSESNRSF